MGWMKLSANSEFKIENSHLLLGMYTLAGAPVASNQPATCEGKNAIPYSICGEREGHTCASRTDQEHTLQVCFIQTLEEGNLDRWNRIDVKTGNLCYFPSLIHYQQPLCLFLTEPLACLSVDAHPTTIFIPWTLGSHTSLKTAKNR